MSPVLPAVARQELWYVDGQPLNTMAYNIATIDGREGIAPREGANYKIGGRAGSIWKPKHHDERPLYIAMWVKGADPNTGNAPASGLLKEQFHTNWMTLKRMFGVYDRLLHIEKYTPSMDGWLYLQTYAEVVGTMQLTHQGPFAATFTVDLLMPDPLWYGDAQKVTTGVYNQGGGRPYVTTSWTNSYGTAFSYKMQAYSSALPTGKSEVYDTAGQPGVVTVTNAGDFETFPVLQIHGPTLNPVVTNMTTGKSVRIGNYDVTIGGSDVITIDMKNKTVKMNGGDRYDWIDRLVSSWWKLVPGDNVITFNDESVGAHPATLEIDYAPAYL